MKSRITIDFQPDYKPVIKFNVDQKSDDVRDKLCRSLIEEAGDGHSSNLLFLKQVDSDHYTHCYEITSTTKQSREHILKFELVNLYRDIPGADNAIHSLFLDLASGNIPVTIKGGVLPSKFQIGDNVIYTTDEKVEKAFEEAKRLHPDVASSEIEYTPDYRMGKVVAIRFTEAKVWYDILDDFTGEVNRDIVSHQTKIPGPPISLAE